MAVVCPNCSLEFEDGIASCPQCTAQAAAWRETAGRAAPAVFGFELDDAPQGIGGWLVLVAIGLAVSPFFMSFYVWRDLHFLSSPGRTLAGKLIPGLPTLVAVEMLLNLALLAGCLALNVLFYREKRILPRCFQLWLIFAFVAALTEYSLTRFGLGAVTGIAANIVATTTEKLAFQTGRALFTAVIWVTYFSASKRVRATFVH
ncbi:MAG TPA: DUF2569 domain-containing protein [Acidobacteriaceae bacterium]|nr:DUF2569 domain-containing protein [Acidobacteriaceae bacterium]